MIKNKPVLGLIQVVSLSLLSSITLPAENTVQSTWTATPLQIDGQKEEWLGDAMTFEKGVGVDYAFRNDGRDLYVLLIFKDPKFLSSIDMTGITLYPNTLGKKDKDWGVKFVKKTVNGAQLIEYMEKMGQPLSEARKEELKDKPQFIVFEATAVNKKGEEIFPAAPVQDIDLPGFRVGRGENMALYEFRIPLVSREVHPAGIGTEPGEDIETGTDLAKETDTGTYEGSLSTGPAGPKKYSYWVDVKLAQAE